LDGANRTNRAFFAEVVVELDLDLDLVLDLDIGRGFSE